MTQSLPRLSSSGRISRHLGKGAVLRQKVRGSQVTESCLRMAPSAEPGLAPDVGPGCGEWPERGEVSLGATRCDHVA